MDINQLKILDVIVNMKSFNKAAELCFVSTSTLTRQVTALEAEIGFPIFERSSFGVSLTPQGEIFYRQTQSIPWLYESAVNAARSTGLGKSKVRIGIFSYTRKAVARACEILKEENANIDFSFVSCRFRDSRATLNSHRADLVLLAEIQNTDDRLFVLPVFRCSNSVIVPESHPLARRKGIRISELDGQTILVSAQTTDSRNFRTMRRLLEERCEHSTLLEYQHPDQADALCQLNGHPILSLDFLETNEGFVHLRLLDAPAVLIGAACRKEDCLQYRPLMERFRNHFIRSGGFETIL